jgi:hypothetical protein
MRSSYDEVHQGSYDVPGYVILDINAKNHSIQNLVKNSEPLVRYFIWRLEREVLIVLLKMLLLKYVPHVHVPLSPTAECDWMQLEL